MDIQNVIHQEIVVNCQNARRNQFFSTKKMNKKSWFQVRVDCRSGMSFAFWVFIDKTTFAPSYTSVFTPIFSELSRRSNLMDGWADLCCWLTYTFNIPVKSRHYVNDGGYLIPSGRRWTTGWAVNTSSINQSSWNQIFIQMKYSEIQQHTCFIPWTCILFLYITSVFIRWIPAFDSSPVWRTELRLQWSWSGSEQLVKDLCHERTKCVFFWWEWIYSQMYFASFPRGNYSLSIF